MMTGIDQEIGQLKCCSKCGETKFIENFYKDSRWGNPRSACKKCTSLGSVDYAKANPDKKREAAKRRRQGGNTKDRDRNRRHYELNKSSELVRAKRYREENREAYLETSRKSGRKRRETVMGRLTDAVSRAMKRGLGGGAKAGRRAFEILPYTPDQLRRHLERQFLPGMNWENYGLYGWHIDHIVPLSSFSYETPDDIDFKACWAITNLRPMWRLENLSKGNKITCFL